MRRDEIPWPRLTQLALGLVLLGGAAMSLCFVVNLWLLDDLAGFLTKNELSFVHRRWFTVSMLAAFALPSFASAPWLRKQPLALTSQTIASWGRRAAPLMLLGPCAPLLLRSAFSGSTLTVLLWALVIGLLAAIFFTGFLDERDKARMPASPLARAQLHSWVPLTLVLAASLALFVHFAVYSLMRHYRMESASYDLAIFDNMMWSLMHGEGFYSSPAYGPEGNHLARHATFAAPLLLPIYALYPHAETLLVIQALLVAGTPVAIYFMVREIVGSAWVACALGLSYGLYAPIHGAVFFDFHFLTAAPVLIVWVFHLLHTDRTRSLVLVTALALAWREDIGAMLAGGGVLLFLSGVRRTRAFVFTLVCLLYFVLVKFAFMPSFGEGATFSWIYKELWPEGERNFGGVIQTLLTNPTYGFETLIDPKKLVFILQLFVPLLFLPLRHRFAWVAALPAAAFTLLATEYPPAYSISFQYTAYWGPALFLGTAVVLRDRFAEPGRRNALSGNVMAILLVTAITSFHFGSVFESPAFQTGFGGIRFDMNEKDREQLAEFRKLAALLPPDASLAATDTEAPHLSDRRFCHTLRYGYHDADFLFVKKSQIKHNKVAQQQFREALDSGEYGFFAAEGEFFLWKRGYSTERNDEGMRMMGLGRPQKSPKARELHPRAP